MQIQKHNDAAGQIREAILRSQYRAVSAVNREQLSLYYGIGRYVSQNSRRGFWGTGAIEKISEQLQKELPGLKGFSATNMKNMRVFYEEWEFLEKYSPTANEIQDADFEDITNRQTASADLEQNRQTTSGDLQSSENELVIIRSIVSNDFEVDENLLLKVIRQPLAAEFNFEEFLQVGFSLHREIIKNCKSLQARLFYIHECSTRFWNYLTLKDYLKADLYGKRGTMPSNFAKAIPDKQLALKAVAMFKDEYLLNFVDIEHIDEGKDDQDERVLEREIVNNIRKFIMSFGSDFIFIGNQYRVIVDDEESFIDLLFFNRELNALVAVELKSGKFRPAYLGQLNFYLSALDTYIKKPHENSSIGIILCREMKKTTVEFAVRDFSKPMGVSTYNKSEELPEKLRKALPDIEEMKKILTNNKSN
ncbi:MAG: PDDEXK nuclease domain-containing protein [Prevotellaceae bacterium]|nr:PDDEXK nuclease domain-containing protein [Prevotellaceae bacterium]